MSESPVPARQLSALLHTSLSSATMRSRALLGVTGSALPAQGQKVQRSFSGTGADSDIVVASARAYASALNKMIAFVAAGQAAAQAAAADVRHSMDPAQPGMAARS